MDLGFLGHQSWWIRSGDVTLLVDPVLGATMGHRTRLPIHPPRTIDPAVLLPVDLVVLTHEHNDHTDLASLALLPRSTPVLVAPLMPSVVVRAIEHLGFTVHRADPEVGLSAGPLHVQLLPGAARAPVAEGRVAQVLLTETLESGSITVLLGVDTPISHHTSQAIRAGLLPTPDAVVVANNTQIPPPGVIGSGRDLLGPDPADGFVGLQLLRELCVTYIAELPSPPIVILCGGGFVDTHELGVPYRFDDHPRLAALATELGHARTVLGPLPGEQVTLTAGASRPVVTVDAHPAVTLHTESLAELRARPCPEGPLPLRPVLPTLTSNEWTSTLERVDQALDALVEVWMAHPQGDAILGCHRWRGRIVGPHRLLIRLVDGPDGAVVWRALDLHQLRFVPIETVDASTTLQTWPFGIEVSLQDLDGLLTGTLMIWDVLGLALRHWAATGPGMASMLCAVFNEGARPHATAVALAHQLTALGNPTKPGQLLSARPQRAGEPT